MRLDYTRWPDGCASRYRRHGYWSGETLADMLAAAARRWPDRTAVVDGQRRIDYPELVDRSERLAGGLHRLGLRAGDRVVVQLPNVAELVELCFALFRLGAVPIMALPAQRYTEIAHFCRFAGATAYVVADRHGGFDHVALAREVADAAPSLRYVLVHGEPGEGGGRARFVRLAEAYDLPYVGPAPRPDDVALLQLSGGSTGVPKLIPRTHDDYLCAARACLHATGFRADDVYLGALPVAHNFPLVSPGVFGALAAGGRTVLARYPAPEVAFRLIEAERVTVTSVVPPLALAWLSAAERTRYDLSSLRLLQVGGAKCGTELAARIAPTLGCRLQQVYGMAEGLINLTRPDDADETVLATQGRPASDADEVRVVDGTGADVPDGTEGELLTRGPYTVRGYWTGPDPDAPAAAEVAAHNATAFTVDGFYRTGDLVRRRPDGYLVVTGRVGDQINRGGEKVAPAEVENHLLAHPSVHDAAVVGVPDRYLGERVTAYVVPTGEAPSAAELTGFVRSRGLAAYKVPDRIEVVAELPTLGVGKHARRRLRGEDG